MPARGRGSHDRKPTAVAGSALIREGPHVTDTIESSTAAAPEGGAPAAAGKKRGGGLNAMLLADLKSMASGMGISGAGSMKKAQLVEAIKARQSGGGQPPEKPKAAPEKPAAQEQAREQAQAPKQERAP